MFNLLKDVSTLNFGQRYIDDPNTGGGASGGSGGQGNSGDNPLEIDPALSDVKLEALSKLSEEDRKVVLDAITVKVKNLQAIGTKKAEELAIKLQEYEGKIADAKIVENIRANPDLSKAIEKTIDDFKTGKLNAKSNTSDVFQTWIDKAATSEERENLISLREKIESGDKSSSEQIKALKEEMAILKASTQSIHSDRAVRGVDLLENKFGKELTDKYKTKLITSATRYRQREGESFGDFMESLFLNVATPEDRRVAFRKENELKEKRETQRRREGLEPGGAGETGTDVEVPRDKGGKVNVGKFASSLVSKLGLSKNL